jgi:hypothetical protein
MRMLHIAVCGLFGSTIFLHVSHPRRIEWDIMKFPENPSSGSRDVPCGRTDDGTDVTKLTVAFRNLAKAPNNAVVDCVWNVMAHAQKPDFVFRRNGRVHLNRRGRQFSRLLAAELCTSACRVCTARASLCSALHSLVSPSLLLPCVTVCHHISTGLYYPLLCLCFMSSIGFSVV